MTDFYDLDFLLENENDSEVNLSHSKLDRETKDLLRRYAQQLRNQILSNLRVFYSGYTPHDYSRTNALLEALDTIRTDSNTGEIIINFNSKAYHPNFTNEYESFVPSLINYGWRNDALPIPRNRPRSYAYYGGSNYLTDAINDFNNKHADENIFVRLYIDDTDVRAYGDYVPYMF